MYLFWLFFFFFKQKTAYEMRISDWSSDVCSSDLGNLSFPLLVAAGTTGSLLGAVFWYIIGRWLGCDRLKRWADRHGRWMTMSPEDVDKAEIGRASCRERVCQYV